ncbi:GNAT family acetyltransferase [Gulosibacter faecalis]|uniref:GNAT family acetyltransferase n=1 Tax=Gulosibacter faecalis TaxID=272240 RepID=A0ABW5V014_9MICO|nr:GNAT family acetyltransferase [Gulosibacter faecalis]
MATPESAAHLRTFTPVDADAVVALWEACGLTRPWNDPRADIARAHVAQPELFLVAEQPGDVPNAGIVGSVMAGFDGHRGWMYYLATAESHRGIGLGRALVEEAERRLEAAGCPKVQLMVRSDNVVATGFYERLGYAPAEVAVLGKRLIED